MTTDQQKDKERRVTWLELFYDLVFVVTISQLAHFLAKDISINGFLDFMLLFIPVCWVWVGATFFATRFYSDDILHRLLILLQMGGAGAIAINIHGALDNTYTGFALSYAFVRYCLVAEYIRVLIKVSSKKEKSGIITLIKRYITGFSIAATVWLVSAFVPLFEIRLLLWIIGLIIDFGFPISAGKLHARFPPHVSHLTERMGLFMLIVLGESIVGIVTGMIEQTWNVYTVTVASLGLCIAFGVWWIYFANLKGTAIHAVREKSRVGIYYIWLYGHFPLVIGIISVGVGIEQLVSVEPNETLSNSIVWLLCLSLAITMSSQVLLQLSLVEFFHGQPMHHHNWIVSRLISISVVSIIPLFLNYVIHDTLFIASLLTAVVASQIILDYRFQRDISQDPPIMDS